MDENVLKMAIAAFLNCMGTVFDGLGDGVSDEFMNAQPEQSPHPRPFAGSLVESMKTHLPDKLSSPDWGSGDDFQSLVAASHLPETPMQAILAVSNWLSQGVGAGDGRLGEVFPRGHPPMALRPVFKQLAVDADRDRAGHKMDSHFYPGKILSPANIFPVRSASSGGDAPKEALDAHKDLFSRVVNQTKALLHARENIELWFEHVDSLFMFCASSIPAGHAEDGGPDVSLYDVARNSSALAAALYTYHRDTDSLTVEAVRELEPRKFLFVSGDFYGIQKYIFTTHGDLRKYRSKLLRGRSFAVSLFSELAADMLCRELGLPSCSIVLNAAGKFTLVAPNTEVAQATVRSVETRINDWLVTNSFGENALGLAATEASPRDLVCGSFVDVWERLQARAEQRKSARFDLNRYAGGVEGFLTAFDSSLSPSICPLCGRRPSSREAERTDFVKEAGSSCKTCRDHVFLGTNLVKKNRLAITTAASGTNLGENGLLEPLFGEYQLSFVSQNELSDMAAQGHLLRYWEIAAVREEGAVPCATAKFLNGYVPVFSEEDRLDARLLGKSKGEIPERDSPWDFSIGDPKTLGHIAATSLIRSQEGDHFLGVESLGILKADVDNLGLLMSCGLSPEQFTLSRLSTLSRQLHLYFSLYLPHLLKTDDRFNDIYTVFAGGDDLFLIGPWNRVVELACVLKDSFAEYVCHNPSVHFSAGISFHKAHTPVDRMAEAAEAALKRSKEAGRKRITIFGETTTWDELERLSEVKRTLRSWLDSQWVNKAMLYRLNDLIRMADRELALKGQVHVHISDMECTKWRSHLVYTVVRNVAKDKKSEQRKEIAAQVSAELTNWLTRFGGRLRIPVWEILYSLR